jgi:hypothetical protein
VLRTLFKSKIQHLGVFAGQRLGGPAQVSKRSVSGAGVFQLTAMTGGLDRSLDPAGTFVAYSTGRPRHGS